MKSLNRFNYTSLHYACKKGYIEIVKLLLKNPNINIDLEDNNDF